MRQPSARGRGEPAEVVLVGLSLLGALPKDGLALLEHGLMMAAMLIPMLLRLDIYSGGTDSGV